MRKLLFFMAISLDGYFEGPGQDITWHRVDDEFNDFAIEQINSVDTLLFGRVTYELMASYWPTPDALADDSIVAGLMNSYPKIVFSTSLQDVTWQNTRLVKANAAQEVTRLKQQPGKDLIIFVSSDLAVSPILHGLIDEFHILVNPWCWVAASPCSRPQQPLNPKLAVDPHVPERQRCCITTQHKNYPRLSLIYVKKTRKICGNSRRLADEFD
jgi:dihydrofolate reductase